MEIIIKYFGLLAELTALKEERLVYNGNTISGLIELLYVKYPKLKNVKFKIAQDEEIVSKDALLTNGQLALLPPFAGG